MSFQIRRSYRKVLWGIAFLMCSLFLLQFVNRPEIQNPPVTGEIKATPKVKVILKKACYDCHSNETNLRWYDKIVPVYWMVAKDVREGRAVLNFSEWDNMPKAGQSALIWEAVNQIQAGAMPIKSYQLVHQDSQVSAADLAVLKSYLSAKVRKTVADTGKTNALEKQYSHWLKGAERKAVLPVALNGIEFIPDYKNWQVVTTSDRFDNGTMRVVFGNDIAIQAIKANHINPWPNGTIFAKVAWDKLVDADGAVKTGAFKQVEYMIKDDKKYASTVGWGFARFKTPEMLPYGKTKLFANECVNCHRPMRDNDFVFTIPVKN